MKSILWMSLEKWWREQFIVFVELQSRSDQNPQNLAEYGLLVGLSVLITGIVIGAFFTYCYFLFVRSTVNLKVLPKRQTTLSASIDEYQTLQHPKILSTQDPVHIAALVQSVIKDLIRSKIVAREPTQINSVLQTPLRESIKHLRQVVEHCQLHGTEHNRKASANEVYRELVTLQNIVTTSPTVFCFAQRVVTQQIQFVQSCLSGSNVQVYAGPQQEAVVAISDHCLQKVLREILLNAVKHNVNNQALIIKVDTAIVDHHLIINVSDNGDGVSHVITDMLTTNIKKPIRYEYCSHKLESAINLFAIQDYLLRNNGDLSVRSARGFLTKVTLRLPLCAQSSLDYVKLSKANLPYSYLSQPYRESVQSILLISNDSQTHEDCLHYFMQEYNLLHAASLEESLQVMQCHKPQCLLIDANRELDIAIEAQDWLQQSPLLADIPVLVISNNVDKSGQLNALQAGISAIVSKPLDYVELNVVIKNLFAEKLKMEMIIEDEIANYHLGLNTNIIFDDKEAAIFLTKFNVVLEQHYAKDNFKRPAAAQVMLMTEKTLSRRLNQYYALGFTEVLRKFRLEKAKQMIASGEKVTTTAYGTGFGSPSYFAKCFKSEYGFAPSLLAKKV